MLQPTYTGMYMVTVAQVLAIFAAAPYKQAQYSMLIATIRSVWFRCGYKGGIVNDPHTDQVISCEVHIDS